MNQRHKFAIFGLLTMMYILYIVILVQGDPVGGTILFNSTSSASSAAQNRTDEGGTITIIRVDATQQNFAWKAYVGNISGTLVLDDNAGLSIYAWSLATLTGEILATRSSSPTWTSLSCVSNAIIASEQTYLSMGAADIDNINNTFNETLHKEFIIAGNTLSESTCRTVYPYINDSAQTPNATTTNFQEIIINDSSSNMIFASELESDVEGYFINSSMDFQMLLPDSDVANNQTQYYFYVELG